MASYKDVLVILGGVLLLLFCIPIKINSDVDEIKEKFDEFLIKYNKSYNASEYEQRLEIFRKSSEIVDSYNSQRTHNLSALYGLTRFSDMTATEFIHSNVRLKPVPFKLKKSRLDRSRESLPLMVDWRKKGTITEVNNQKMCGACWAFSVVENLEAMHAIKTGKLERLSVQQMIDCSLENNGCDGGDMCVLLEWMTKEKVNVTREEAYPLHLKQENCIINGSAAGVQVKQYTCDNLVGNEEVILKYLATRGPVSVAVNAISWQNYLEGVIQFHCDGSLLMLNHAVQIVGYNMGAEIPYYILRNSWGRDFGDDGYLYAAIGGNICGLANKVSSLIV